MSPTLPELAFVQLLNSKPPPWASYENEKSVTFHVASLPKNAAVKLSPLQGSGHVAFGLYVPPTTGPESKPWKLPVTPALIG